MILDLLFDDENLEKMYKHGVKPTQALEVIDNLHRIGRNRKERRGLYLVVGRDNGGACISMPVEMTHDATLWRPITAWYCKQHEWNLLPRG
ncbi:MAG: hypothetical protein WD359_02115 [Dehalococcoidia bacterium]